MKNFKKTSILAIAATAGMLANIHLPTANAVTLPDGKTNAPKIVQHETSNYIEEVDLLDKEKKARLAIQRAEQERQYQIEIQKQHFKQFIDMVNVTNVETLDLTTPSYLTPTQANEVLKGTGLDGLGEAFVNAEHNHGVNAYYLMAHAAVESSWGTSYLFHAKNNLFGFTAYDASPGASATSFASKADCIDFVAKYVKEHYLTKGGQYYHGPTLQGMNVKYASADDWANVIADVFDMLVDKTVVPS
jgi:beta-N-acetylglucosaminidase